MRHNAAVILRHLAERDPESISYQMIERALFYALDIENEAHIAESIQLTLNALEFAQCPSRPSRWLDVCSEIVMGSITKDRAHNDSLMHDDNKDNEFEENEIIVNDETESSNITQSSQCNYIYFLIKKIIKL